jgi:hypothetical protein
MKLTRFQITGLFGDREGGMTRSQAEYERVMREFTCASAAFLKAIRPIMAWVVASRIDKIKVNLSNVDLGSVFVRGKDGTWRRKKNAFAIFAQQVGARDYRPKCLLYKLTLRSISKSDERLWLRGKYALWFFTK